MRESGRSPTSQSRPWSTPISSTTMPTLRKPSASSRSSATNSPARRWPAKPHNEPTFLREKAGQPRTIARLESQLESASDEQREQLEELDVDLHVPGHGPPFTDSRRLNLVAEYYCDLTSYADTLGIQRRHRSVGRRPDSRVARRTRRVVPRLREQEPPDASRSNLDKEIVLARVRT